MKQQTSRYRDLCKAIKSQMAVSEDMLVLDATTKTFTDSVNLAKEGTEKHIKDISNGLSRSFSGILKNIANLDKRTARNLLSIKKQNLVLEQTASQYVTKFLGQFIDTVVKQFVELLLNELAKGNTVNVPMLGKFAVVDTAPRKRFNINKGEAFESASNKLIKFYPSKRVAAKMVKVKGA